MPRLDSAPISLFLCSYRRDLRRAERLLQSVAAHNRQGLPVCIAVPESDLPIFRDRLSSHRVRWVTQEDVFTADPRIGRDRFPTVTGSVRQQVVKSEAWRLDLSPNLMVLDSDCVFIRPFSEEDLLDRDGAPWTIIDLGLLDAADRYALRKVRPDWERTMGAIRRFFGTEHMSPVMHGPAPFLWSNKVWRGLHEKWLLPRAWTCIDLIESLGSEFMVYGEAARALGCIPERQRGELFKCYHYIEQWWHDQLHGVSEAVVARDFLGVVYQSNWQHELDFGRTKSAASRAVRNAKRALRWLRWRVLESGLPPDS